jgi:hypothetical protein
MIVTADGNAGGNALTIFMATQRQRSRQHDDNALATLMATYFANFDSSLIHEFRANIRRNYWCGKDGFLG